ncbi:hypothetical protein [Kocuria tytonis]|nr:hypothetical protein [Kocuria tytonis]
MLAAVLIYAATGAVVCLTMSGMVALLVGWSLWTDWRDGVRA